MISNTLNISAARQQPLPVTSEFEWFNVNADPSGWDALVRQGWQGMFHLSAVLMAHARDAARPRGVVLRCGGGTPVAVGGLLRGRRCFEALSFPPLAATGDPTLVDSLINWLRVQGVRRVALGSFAGGVEGYQIQAEGAALRERLEFLWDLRTPAEQRLRALRSSHRRKLQKLLKRDLVLKEIDSWQPLRMTWQRIHWARRRELSFTPRQLLDMYGYHRFLHKHLTLPGIGRLYGIYDDAGRLLSSAYMLEADGMAFYMIGASSPAGYGLNASLRLFWELAELYSSRGYRGLHLGGAPREALSDLHEEHGVLRFKAGFGIEPISRVSLSTRT